jgi:molecular chaperone GrpE
MKKNEKKIEEEIERLREEIERLKKEKEEYLAGWQRARADHLNYIKEEKQRLKEILEYANEELILKLLPILDSFERAEEAIPQDLVGNEIVKGFLQIKEQIKEILGKEGLEEIEARIGEKFNPEIHETSGTVERNDLSEESIAQIVQKGYKFKGKLIRPVKVKLAVSKGRS